MTKKRIGLGALALVVIGLLGLAFLPAPAYQPPARDIADESSFDLAQKVGWYRLEDGSSRLLTWGAPRGLALYGFGHLQDDLRRTVFHPISAHSYRSPGGPPERALDFTLGPDQSVVEAWLQTPADTLRLIPESGPYQTKEVTFGSGAVELSGLLFVPEGEGPFPAAVFIHGSGSSDRDSFWYLSPADYLARQGVAVLLPDKRGSGKSGGEWHLSSFDDFAGDAEGARALLAAHPLVDSSRIGLVGFSQGGWIAPLAASQSPSVAYVVAISASAATPSEQLAYEVGREIANAGAPDLLANLLAPIFARRAKMARSQWWRLNGDFDPIEHWRALQVPSLMLFGQEDQNVDVARSLERLRAAGVSDRETFAFRVFPELGHALIRSDTGWLEREYLEALAEFIRGT